MIDLHTHLLPGVDDGSRSMEESLLVLQRFASEGVTAVYCTPHLNASQAEQVEPGTHSALLDELRSAAPDGLEIEFGWEIMLDQPGVDLRAPHLHLGDSSAALVEFSRLSVPREAAGELFRIRMSGVTPIVAHPERYVGCTPELVAEWRRAGAVIQMDAAMLLGRGATAQAAHDLLAEGLVDCIASDNHGDRRSLGAARRWLEEMGADEQADLLTRVNAEHVLSGQPTIPVQPLETPSRGMLSRLRELIFGRR